MASALPRQLPTPTLPDSSDPAGILASLRTLYVRLTNWVSSASDFASSLIIRQTDLVPVPDGTTTVFTVPFAIEQDDDGTPKALLFVDGKAVPVTRTDPPPAGFWLLRNMTGQTQEIVLGTAPGAGMAAFFGVLVARRLL